MNAIEKRMKIFDRAIFLISKCIYNYNDTQWDDWTNRKIQGFTSYTQVRTFTYW